MPRFLVLLVHSEIGWYPLIIIFAPKTPCAMLFWCNNFLFIGFVIQISYGSRENIIHRLFRSFCFRLNLLGFIFSSHCFCFILFHICFIRLYFCHTLASFSFTLVSRLLQSGSYLPQFASFSFTFALLLLQFCFIQLLTHAN